MIKIDNVEVLGWEHAIRGMRNPLNSWDKSDSQYNDCNTDCVLWDCCRGYCSCCPIEYDNDNFFMVGKKDFALMRRLSEAGTDHRKFMRMIAVYLDIAAPLYWWKEFDTYKVGTVANSCSTMHKIADKEFMLEDFSHEHLMANCDNHEAQIFAESSMELLARTVLTLNVYRDMFLRTNDRKYWWQMIQLLPTSYNQKRTVMLNYEVLANIYKSRRNHKLDEWRDFCAWIGSLPYSELITGKENKG